MREKISKTHYFALKCVAKKVEKIDEKLVYIWVLAIFG
jgi:hypothetical protein